MISFFLGISIFLGMVVHYGTSLSSSTVVYGPASQELVYLTAKVVAREGIDAAYVCASGSETVARKLMYGTDYSEQGVDEVGNANPVVSGEDIQEALQKCNSICLIGYDTPIEEKYLNTLVDSAGENLSKIVLLSKMGVSKAENKGSGFFGGGGGDSQLWGSENRVRSLCESKNIHLSIVRAGILKGGGAGRVENNVDIGLNKSYYDTLLDIVEAQVTMSHDKFTLGADISKGDGIELPNMFVQMGSKSTFEASPNDTNRAVLANVIAASLLLEQNKPVEFSVSSEKAEKIPSLESLLKNLQSLC